MLLFGGMFWTFSFQLAGAKGVTLAGNDVIDRPEIDDRSDFYILDSNNPFQSNALVSDWEVFANTASPIELVLYRKLSSSYTVVGRSGLETPTVGFNKFTLASPISVEAGDFVGLYLPSEQLVPFTLDAPFVGDLGNLSGTVLFTSQSSGANPTAFTGSSNRTYSVRANGTIPEPASAILILMGCIYYFEVGRRR